MSYHIALCLHFLADILLVAHSHWQPYKIFVWYLKMIYVDRFILAK